MFNTLVAVFITEFFQQEEVLTELHTYIPQNPPPVDAPPVKCTLQYLTACSQLFEFGLLSHKKVSVKDKAVLESIDTGYQFFCELVSITYPMDHKTLHYVVTVIMPQISSEILQR